MLVIDWIEEDEQGNTNKEMHLQRCIVPGCNSGEFLTNSQLPYCVKHAEEYLKMEWEYAQNHRNRRIKWWTEKFKKWIDEFSLNRRTNLIAKWMNILFEDKLNGETGDGKAEKNIYASR